MESIKWLLMVAILSIGFPVIADQPYYVSNKDANRARELLRLNETVRFYCKSCGEKKSTLRDIAIIGLTLTANRKYWQVSINDKAINLANLYVPYEGQWYNVAMLLELPTNGVNQILGDI